MTSLNKEDLPRIHAELQVILEYTKEALQKLDKICFTSFVFTRNHKEFNEKNSIINEYDLDMCKGSLKREYDNLNHVLKAVSFYIDHPEKLSNFMTHQDFNEVVFILSKDLDYIKNLSLPKVKDATTKNNQDLLNIIMEILENDGRKS